MKPVVSKFALSIAFVFLSDFSIASSVECRQFYRPPTLTDAKYLMNTNDLMSFVERGGRPRAGISAVWSSRMALSEILSLRGPLGPLGPVSEFGPIGDNTWNPSFWWNQFVRANVWNVMSNSMVAKAGPLSKWGSLGDLGPLAKDWGEGAYSILGTRGILGPLGPLGALGLMGALQSKGLKGPDENGNYFYGTPARIVKTVKIDWEDGVREFEIVERYSSKEADRRSKEGSLENSYLVDASLSPFELSKSYKSLSNKEKMISVLVVPDLGWMTNMFGVPMQSNFSIEVRAQDGRIIGSSNQMFQANFVQFAVPKDMPYEVTVKRQGFSVGSAGYRLISVGAGAEFFQSFPHILDGVSMVELNGQIQSYLKRVSEKNFEVEVN